MIKHYFAGVFTSEGFINLFDELLPPEAAEKRYFLKGSSGSGKSTFLKKIAAWYEAKGYDTERVHCANDIESLDAVVIPALGLMMMDATAPHAADMEIPMGVDEVIDFSRFLEEGKVRQKKGEIIRLMNQKKRA
jgi:ABC-type hemin transport system ATPase subunit